MTEKQQPRARIANEAGFIITALVILSAVAAFVFVVVAIWLFRIDRNIKTRFAEKRFAPPVEFFSAPESVRAGSTVPPGYFEAIFSRKNFRARDFGQPVQAGDYSVWNAEQCLSIVGPLLTPAPPSAGPGAPATPETPAPAIAPAITSCIAFRNSAAIAPPAGTLPGAAPAEDPVQIIALDASKSVAAVFTGAQPQRTPVVSIEPELFAQYYGETPILRKVVSLGTVPTNCLNALLSIEDSKFLEHPGISFTGLARAAWTVVRPHGRAQGGSTLTQQLVKNYFLTDERTMKRKLTEIPMAMLVERHATKDEILETYINLIYMGQNGPFQVRGFAAASEHYFGKSLADLDLPQCALLAGVLNNPAGLNPFQHPDKALARRTKVLDRMLELGKIDGDQAKGAKASPLPERPSRSLTEPAPYFVQSVRRNLRERGIDESEGLRVYTTLNLRAQETAHQAIRSGLDKLESGFAHLKKLKSQGKNLEAVLLSSDPLTGEVQALVGGRGFLLSPFNRATDSKRQVGSVMKPFVYLTAFEMLSPEGKPYTPLSPVADEGIAHKYEGQSWTPRNYEGVYNGNVPIFYALKESLNAATANLGVTIGLSNVIDTARRLGVKSNITALPSLTLGAFELSPMEVLESYGALARLGQKVPLTMIRRVERPDGTSLLQVDPKPELAVAADSVAEIVGVMKQTILTGTARSARAAGFVNPAAGKTGTTNDKKDAWFAGFTPYHVAIVWVGYDDNTPHNLTGASGAVPIWTNYMKNFGAGFPAEDFPWPESVEKVVVTPEQQLTFGVPNEPGKTLAPVELIFKKGQSPIPPAPGITLPSNVGG